VDGSEESGALADVEAWKGENPRKETAPCLANPQAGRTNLRVDQSLEVERAVSATGRFLNSMEVESLSMRE